MSTENSFNNKTDESNCCSDSVHPEDAGCCSSQGLAQKPPLVPPVAEQLNAEQVNAEQESQISIDYFSRVQLRVGQVLEAESIPKSEKLLKMKVDLGEERGPRQILAGIAKHFQAADLVGRKIVIVANLKPAKLMGQLSEGMVLCASDDQGHLELLSPGTIVSPGSIVR